jgi:hypothetical protein
VALPKIAVDGINVIALSPQSPLGAKLMGNQIYFENGSKCMSFNQFNKILCYLHFTSRVCFYLDFNWYLQYLVILV